MESMTFPSSTDPSVSHARQSGAAENLVRGSLDCIDGYRNPVIRLLAADGLLRSEERLKETRMAAVVELRVMGWTWVNIGAVLGTIRPHAWQIGNGR